jgi:hypothetical protein
MYSFFRSFLLTTPLLSQTLLVFQQLSAENRAAGGVRPATTGINASWAELEIRNLNAERSRKPQNPKQSTEQTQPTLKRMRGLGTASSNPNKCT